MTSEASTNFRVPPACAVRFSIRPDGERFLFPYWGEGIPADADWLPDDAADNADALLIDGRWVEGASRLAEQAHRRGLPIVLDFDIDTPAVWELVELSTHVIADEDMAAAHGGVKSLIRKIEGLGAVGRRHAGRGRRGLRRWLRAVPSGNRARQHGRG